MSIEPFWIISAVFSHFVFFTLFNEQADLFKALATFSGVLFHQRASPLSDSLSMVPYAAK